MKRLLLTLFLLTALGAGGAAWWLNGLLKTTVSADGCLVWSGESDVEPAWQASDVEGWEACLEWMSLRGYEMKPGRFCPAEGETVRSFARRLAIGGKSEVRVVVPAHRDPGVIAAAIARPLRLDSATVHEALAEDSILWRLVPNTYRMYWSTSADELVERLQTEYESWWTPARRKLAEEAGMTPHEVVTLAAIVQEEIAVRSEAPRVAGLYRNRLRRGMKLQADPTLKFALGNWDVRRLLDRDKNVQSPYNTYMHAGLPPGPIRIPEPDIVDAVLNAEAHDFIFMCARPDGSGTHAFARNYNEHLQNARNYTNWLNAQRIFR